MPWHGFVYVFGSLIARRLSCHRPLFNSSGYPCLRVRAVTPLTVLLRLGSCSTYLSRKRAVRLLSWLGFNALIGSTGMLNYILEVYSKPFCLIALRTLRAISFA